MTSGAPRRPPVSITPMPVARPIPGGPRRTIAVFWVAAIVLMLAAVAVVAVNRRTVARRLAITALGDNPGTKFDDALRSANIALLIGAALVAATLVCAAVAWVRSRRPNNAARSWLLTATITLVAAAFGMLASIQSSGAQLSQAGVPVGIQWAPIAAAVLATIGTVFAYLGRV